MNTTAFWKTLWLCTIVLCTSSSAVAVSKPAVLIRACLDRPTFTLTVNVDSPTDGCGSFTDHKLYGREDALSPWKMLKKINTLNISSISTVLPNTKSWELFLVTNFACNGIDTFSSNHIFIDKTAPSQFEPDSISVEYSTQKIIAGWSKPLDTDILGFSLFKFSGGGNALLIDTMSTFYRFSDAIFDPKMSGNKFCIASFDSCLNGGLLSNYHSPINLSIQTQTRFWCDKKTKLTWSKYLGWTSSGFSIWRYNVTDSKWDNLINMPADLIGDPSVYSFTDSTYQTNKSYRYFVRALKKDNPSVSSSSNAINIDYTFTGSSFPISVITGISVVAADQLKIDGTWKKDGPLAILSLEKKQGTSWFPVKSFSSDGLFSHLDNSTKTEQNFTEYRLIRKNDCGIIDDSSYTSKSMLLTENQGVISWNNYLGWSNSAINTAFDYTIENKVGSTWNTVASTPSSSQTLPSSLFGDQKIRVKIYSKDGKLPINYELYSNEISVFLGFDNSLKDTTLIPTALNPTGVNTHFKITNPSIGFGESVLTIYNRWGEKLFDGDGLLGWNGSDTSGKLVPQGVYVYLIQCNYRNRKTTHSGTLVLIQ